VKNLKGGVPIRTILISTVFMMLLTYCCIGFFGGYQYNNRIAMNGTLAQTYYLVGAAANTPYSASSGLFSLQNITTQENATYSNLASSGFLGSLNIAASSMSMVLNFAFAIPVTIYTFMSFIAVPLNIIIPVGVGYIMAGLVLLLVSLIILSIVSGLLIYPT